MSDLLDPVPESDAARHRAALTWLDRGIAVFSEIQREKKRVSYGEWTERLAERWAPKPGDDSPLARCWNTHRTELDLWMWKALLAMPGYGTHARRAVAVHREEKYAVELFPAGTEFFVDLGPGADEMVYIQNQAVPVVLVKTREPLMMTKGKSGFLECNPVHCHVWIPVRDVQSKDREEILLGPAVKEVEVFPGVVRGTVGSLNQAATVASRRMAPHRRAHVGNIYQCVSWTDRRKAITLKSIREAVHAGVWQGIHASPGLVQRGIYLSGTVDPDGPRWPCRRDGSVAQPLDPAL
ncbi:MAG: hypothetical protein Q8S73_02420 [Deltaproteobacteria bacterium]|nr:hypothetical protein [Deltaproteobacteria bacterium]